MQRWSLLTVVFSVTCMLATSAGQAIAQVSTHWLGTSTGTEYYFATPVPTDVAAMLTASDPKYLRFRDLPKASSQTIDGKTYSLVTITIAWDNDLIDRGAIAFSRNGGVENGAFANMDTKSPHWKAVSDQIKAQARPKGTWKYADLMVLHNPSDTPPTVRIPIPEIQQLRTKLAALNGGPTKPGQFYSDVKIPADLEQVRSLMLAYGNAGRRAPDFRLKNGSKTATDLSRDTVATLSNSAEKVNKDNPTPPYFNDHALDSKLNDAAQLQAEYQASILSVTHDGPRQFKNPKTGKVVSLFKLEDRASFFDIGNVVEGCGAGTIDQYPHGWMASDTHFRPWFNVDKFTTTIGYGVAKGSDGTWYFAAVPSVSDKPSALPTPNPVATPTAPANQPNASAPQKEAVFFPMPRDKSIDRSTKYFSKSRNHYLIFQPDGNLAIYTAQNHHVWGLDLVGVRFKEAATAAMEADGNLVVRDAKGNHIWSALHKDPDTSAYLTLTAEGVLQLVSGNTGTVLWSSR